MSISEERPLRVLVVDDNEDAVRVLALLLRKNGHEVETASNGAEALRLAEHFEPDCVVSDIGMPGIDGYELARQIRSHSRFKDTPLIALTAYNDADKIREAGFDHHLIKPATMSAIVPLIAEIQALKSRLKQVELGVEKQSAALETIKDLVHEVGNEVRTMNTELKDEVRDLKQELQEVKEEVKEIKEELKEAQD